MCACSDNDRYELRLYSKLDKGVDYRGERIPESPAYGTGRVLSDITIATSNSEAGFPLSLMISSSRGGFD